MAGLKDRYGPWAVVAGASEGTGLAIARHLASEGIHCVLVARRAGPLEALAADLRAEFGIETVVAPVDLSLDEACEQVATAVGAREIGLYVSNAGADPTGAHFLDAPIDDWVGQIQRGVITTMRSCHRYGTAMRARGRGGLLLIGSGGCYGGGAYMSVYSGLKAFGLNFAEGLWAELSPHGVDVLFMALSTTDTPALRKLLAAKGVPLVEGLADPADVAAHAFARLPHGPITNWGQADDEPGMSPVSAAARRQRVLAIGESTRRIFGS
ncbi:SDR family NAD(P)-dependent oxidoreductase [Novosphingobium sp.]|uniref:SDR family NAD(P)-dependent oxidoreductase n=1 Tax=Novosphingobium sp. TaxID=1874826 RepID=UPI0025E2FD30|nr:SDR family NAD(P)-dependent oxidoreductase [Novosphingobium sp.]